jgi:hypothetical protein
VPLRSADVGFDAFCSGCACSVELSLHPDKQGARLKASLDLVNFERHQAQPVFCVNLQTICSILVKPGSDG